MLDRRSFALTSPDKQTVPVGMDRGILDIGSSVLDTGSAFFSHSPVGINTLYQEGWTRESWILAPRSWILDRRVFALSGRDKHIVSGGVDRGILDIGSAILNRGSVLSSVTAPRYWVLDLEIVGSLANLVRFCVVPCHPPCHPPCFCVVPCHPRF